MTKKFVHTDDSLSGKETKNEFLIPDIYNGTKKLIGLETLSSYDSGIVVFTGVEQNIDVLFKRVNDKRKVGFFKRTSAKAKLKEYLEQINNLKIGDSVCMGENLTLNKMKKK